MAPYAASKSAVASLTKTLAIELAESGVNVNAIAPGVFSTEMSAPMVKDTPRGEEMLMRTPMHRFGKPQEMVGPAIFLASEAAAIRDRRSDCGGRRLPGERGERVERQGPRDQGNKGPRRE